MYWLFNTVLDIRRIEDLLRQALAIDNSSWKAVDSEMKICLLVVKLLVNTGWGMRFFVNVAIMRGHAHLTLSSFMLQIALPASLTATNVRDGNSKKCNQTAYWATTQHNSSRLLSRQGRASWSNFRHSAATRISAWFSSRDQGFRRYDSEQMTSDDGRKPTARWSTTGNRPHYEEWGERKVSL